MGKTGGAALYTALMCILCTAPALICQNTQAWRLQPKGPIKYDSQSMQLKPQWPHIYFEQTNTYTHLLPDSSPEQTLAGSLLYCSISHLAVCEEDSLTAYTNTSLLTVERGGKVGRK